MTRPIVFIDTETTSLRPDRRVWEVAYIVRDGGPEGDREFSAQVWDIDLTEADPASLAIGGFYERHDRLRVPTGDNPVPEWPGATEQQVAGWVERDTRGATIVANNPAFDAECLASMLRRNGYPPSWHYQLRNVVDVAIGWLIGNGAPLDTQPVKSDELSRLCGVEPPTKDRHTAMGDARWVRDWWDAITRPAGGAS